MLHDLALLTMLYGAGAGWIHAQALINTADISAAQFQPYVAAWLNNVIVPSYGSLDAARVLDEADYAIEVSNLNANQLALEHVIKASKELGISAEWLIPTKANFDQLVVDGFGSNDPAKEFEIIRSKS